MFVSVTAECYMEYNEGYNAVHGNIPYGPTSSNAPHYWYFGTFPDEEYQSCANMCLLQDGCQAFAFHYSSFLAPWTSHCYGRSPHYLVMQSNVVSGVKVCSGELIMQYIISYIIIP